MIPHSIDKASIRTSQCGVAISIGRISRREGSRPVIYAGICSTVVRGDTKQDDLVRGNSQKYQREENRSCRMDRIAIRILSQSWILRKEGQKKRVKRGESAELIPFSSFSEQDNTHNGDYRNHNDDDNSEERTRKCPGYTPKNSRKEI